MRPPALVTLAIVFGLSLGVRGVAASRVALIERDGIDYLAAARPVARGDLGGTLAHHYPPAYPIVVAAASRLGRGEPDEAAGQRASALSGALFAVAVAIASGLAFGKRAGAIAGLAAALHPSCVEQAAKVTADPLFAALVMGAIAAAMAGLTRSRAWLFVAGALAAASYLARPEGVLVFLAIALVAALAPRGCSVHGLGGRTREAGGARLPSISKRALNALIVLAPAIAIALAYMIAIKPHAGLNGGEVGLWKLTKKRELFLESGGELVFPRDATGARHVDLSGAASVLSEALKRALWQLWLLVAEGNVLLALALVPFIGSEGGPAKRGELRSLPFFVRSKQTNEGRVLAALAIGSGVALVAAYSLVRTDTRYAAILFALALPFAGRGIELVLAPIGSRKLACTLLAAFLIIHLGVATRARLTRKQAWREAGEDCHAVGTVASTDPRVAFYGQVKFVDLGRAMRAAHDPEDAARAALEVARNGGARAIVLGDTHPDERALVDALERQIREITASADASPLICGKDANAEKVAVFFISW